MVDFTNKEELEHLLKKYLEGKASPQEIAFLEKYYQYFDKEPGLAVQLSAGEKESMEQELLSRIWEKAEERKVVPLYRRTWLRIAAAAVFLLTAGTLSFVLFNKDKARSVAELPILPGIVPGGNKAILTLGDNTMIVLDSAADGTLARQGQVQLIKLGDGQLAYEGMENTHEKIIYNTVATPRGGQYQLVLSDGTKVWLNAASSLRFPASFPAGERKVEVTGEVYFEVAHNASKPFRVDVAGKGTVEVLGTHFNINSYDEESSSKITLLEGAVRVTKNGAALVLKPGQQAQLAGGISVVDGADLEEVMAWKNGKFFFNKTDIRTTMRQIARWYDVEIVYNENAEGYFNGSIARAESIAKTLQMLEMTGEIHFDVEGRKIIVRP